MRRFDDIFFRSVSKFVHVLQMVEPANAARIRPLKPDQLDSCGNHLIPVAVESRVDKDIARGGAYSAVISRLFKAASQHNRGIGAQMPMTRQAEAAGQRVYSGSDVPKARAVDLWCHV